MNTITGYGSSLFAEAKSRALNDYVARLDEISTSSRHILRQVNNLLDLAKIEMATMPLAIRIFDLVGLVREIVAEVQPIANKNGNTLTVNIGNLAGMNADKDKVRAEIDRLYNKGLRYIFPVHLVNNHFGGTCIGDDMLNIANEFMNHAAFEVDPGTNGEHINFYLQDLDYTEEAAAIASAAPLAPAILGALMPVADAILAGFGVPPGSSAALVSSSGSAVPNSGQSYR